MMKHMLLMIGGLSVCMNSIQAMEWQQMQKIASTIADLKYACDARNTDQSRDLADTLAKAAQSDASLDQLRTTPGQHWALANPIMQQDNMRDLVHKALTKLWFQSFAGYEHKAVHEVAATNKYAFSVSRDDGSIKTLNIKTGKILEHNIPVATYDHRSICALHPDGTKAAVTVGFDTLYIVDAEKGFSEQPLQSGLRHIRSAVFKKESNDLLIECDDTDGRRIVDTGTQQTVYKLGESRVYTDADKRKFWDQFFESLSSGNGEIIVTWCLKYGEGKDIVTLIDAATGSVKNTIECDERFAKIALSKDGKSMALHAGNVINIYDIATNTKKHTYEEPADLYAIDEITLSPDGSFMALNVRTTPGRSKAYIIDLKTGEKKFGTDNVISFKEIDISPDNSTFVVNGHGGLHIYDRITGQKSYALNDVWDRAIALSPDGMVAISGATSSLREGCPIQLNGSVQIAQRLDANLDQALLLHVLKRCEEKKKSLPQNNQWIQKVLATYDEHDRAKLAKIFTVLNQASERTSSWVQQ